MLWGTKVDSLDISYQKQNTKRLQIEIIGGLVKPLICDEYQQVKSLSCFEKLTIIMRGRGVFDSNPYRERNE